MADTRSRMKALEDRLNYLEAVIDNLIIDVEARIVDAEIHDSRLDDLEDWQEETHVSVLDTEDRVDALEQLLKEHDEELAVDEARISELEDMI